MTEKQMSNEERLKRAMDLLERVESFVAESAPDADWWRDYFLLTGDHMVRTEEGWAPGSSKDECVREYGDDYILEEVNAPSPGGGATEQPVTESPEERKQ